MPDRFVVIGDVPLPLLLDRDRGREMEREREREREVGEGCGVRKWWVRERDALIQW